MKRNALILVVTLALFSAFAFWQFPDQVAAALPASLAVGAGVAGLIMLYFRFRPKLGTFTAAAAVSVVSGILFALISLISPTCPIPEIEGRCPPHAVGTITVVGALTPLIVGLLALPLYALYRMIRWAWDVKTGKRIFDTERLGRFGRWTGITKGTKKNAEPAKEVESAAAKEERRRNGGKKTTPTPKQVKPRRGPRGRS